MWTVIFSHVCTENLQDKVQNLLPAPLLSIETKHFWYELLWNWHWRRDRNFFFKDLSAHSQTPSARAQSSARLICNGFCLTTATEVIQDTDWTRLDFCLWSFIHPHMYFYPRNWVLQLLLIPWQCTPLLDILMFNKPKKTQTKTKTKAKRKTKTCFSL